MYQLVFLPRALKAWKKLTPALRRQFGKKLDERLADPRIALAKLREMPDCYKIKLHGSGYRLVYKVVDSRIEVLVLAIGKREGEQAYGLAERELAKLDD
ncbi:type II toxin-antitoxin system RelE/ParE family toxin [Sphingomonas gilva]|uniref:Type II toxin-antitoxin system RelE/ParE family toxin n=1 Tax=Sphingomonas gilva TaxID=2305907 RepID=A0A396RL15_9SPHN|nr:type II toxin-antitoxin system RelE/ParE family toxin [Sphingomonas gilva]RHW16799.1 type II toxin-antitoxin system RelE/ParE family toxin [Sphingomonas gilva]